MIVRHFYCGMNGSAPKEESEICFIDFWELVIAAIAAAEAFLEFSHGAVEIYFSFFDQRFALRRFLDFLGEALREATVF
jgi:hypothetical protein